MDLITGQILNNRYRIVRLLGKGGFGAIYRAWDLNLKAPCAIKHNMETSADAGRQFAREASLLANLRHPHLPRVYDYFIPENQGQYLVMDFIDGDDLQQMLDARPAGSPFPEAQALTWILQVSDALTYLHNHTPPVIHRDIKPANIRIAPDGKAFLVDFGIAKVYDPHTATTMAAKAVTPGFSPPEQYSGKGTDTRTDIYALGATLYALLTGEIPPESVFRVTGTDTLRNPRASNPAISPGIEASILKAMEIQSDRRFQRVEDFQAVMKSPSSVPLPPIEATTRYPQGTGTVAVPQSVQPMMQTPPLYPDALAPEYPALAAQKPKLSGMVVAAVIVGGLGLLALVLFGVLVGGILNFGGEATFPPELALTQTRLSIMATTQAVSPATSRPANTPLPSPTRPQQANASPTPVPTDTARPINTEPPPPTQPPQPVEVMVRIRNRTGKNVNLYRIGLSGETHLLGWLVPNYYGEYKFPSLGSWTIRFCQRDDAGNDSNCREKSINVTDTGQEFPVP